MVVIISLLRQSLIYIRVTDHILSNEPKIINHKKITDNFEILNAVYTFLSSAGFNEDQHVRQSKKSYSALQNFI